MTLRKHGAHKVHFLIEITSLNLLAPRTPSDATQWADMSSGQGAQLEQALSIKERRLCVERKLPFLDNCLDEDFKRSIELWQGS